MKRDDQQPGLLYHSLHGRVSLKGCLPLAFILVGCAVYGVVSTLEVVMPKPVRSRGEGQVYYRNDELIHFQIRQRSPLPLNLPTYADPARQEAAAAVKREPRMQAGPQGAPAFDFLLVPPDSIVLNEADLLELPPENWSVLQHHTPVPATEDEEQQEEEESPEDDGSTPAEAVDAADEQEEEGKEVQP